MTGSSETLVLDFTINQTVYETHHLPNSLLKWRVKVGQEVQLILPTFHVGDTWKIRSVQEAGRSWLSAAIDTDVIDFGCASQQVHEIDAQPVVAKGGLEYPGVSFTFVGRKSGKVVTKLVKSNSLHNSGHDVYSLELIVVL